VKGRQKKKRLSRNAKERKSGIHQVGPGSFNRTVHLTKKKKRDKTWEWGDVPGVKGYHFEKLTQKRANHTRWGKKKGQEKKKKQAKTQKFPATARCHHTQKAGSNVEDKEGNGGAEGSHQKGKSGENQTDELPK